MTNVQQVGPFPVSHIQEQMVRCASADGRSSAWVAAAYRLLGALDEAVLESTVRELVARHAAFRTTLSVADGHVTQVVAPERDLRLVRVAVAGEHTSHVDDVNAALRAELSTPCDLVTGGPLSRAVLTSVGPSEHILVLAMHHSIVDGWSTKVLAAELSAIYRAHAVGETPALAELPIHLGHVAMEERAARNPRAAEYWRASLDTRRSQDVGLGILPPPSAEQRCVLYSEPIVPISAPDVARLAELARAHRAPFGVALVAAIVSGLADAAREGVTIGFEFANRVRRDQYRIVGCLCDYIPLHIDLRGSPTFTELLVRVLEAWKTAHAHRLPYGQVHSMLRGQQLWCEGGLTDLAVNYVANALPSDLASDFSSDELAVVPHHLPVPEPLVFLNRRHIAPSPCHLNLWPSSQGIYGEVAWMRSTQGIEPVRALKTRLASVVSQATSQPRRAMLTEA
jgi:hypothetical protein